MKKVYMLFVFIQLFIKKLLKFSLSDVLKPEFVLCNKKKTRTFEHR